VPKGVSIRSCPKRRDRGGSRGHRACAGRNGSQRRFPSPSGERGRRWRFTGTHHGSGRGRWRRARCRTLAGIRQRASPRGTAPRKRRPHAGPRPDVTAVSSTEGENGSATHTERSGAPKQDPCDEHRACRTSRSRQRIRRKALRSDRLPSPTWELGDSASGRYGPCRAPRAPGTEPPLDREVERQRHPPSTWSVRGRPARPRTRTPARFGVLGTRSPPWRTSSAELSRSVEAGKD
jgi:hypothetical protein